MNHKGTAPLETERLLLRRYTVEDAPAMYANWASDPEVTRYLTWQPHANVEKTRKLLAEWVKEYEKPDYYSWGLELRQTGELIGSLSVVHIDESIMEAELGWFICRRFWGQGLMPEAVKAVIGYLFDAVGLDFILVGHFEWNRQSARVIEKCGFEYVRTIPYQTRCGTTEPSREYILYKGR